MKNQSTKCIAWVVAVGALALWPLAEASAIQLTLDSAGLNAGNTAPVNANGTVTRLEWGSTVSILNSGGTVADIAGSSVQAQTRYSSVVGATTVSGLSSGSGFQSANTDYSINFSISGVVAGEIYDLQIDTSRLGAMVCKDNGSRVGNAALTGVTGTLTGGSIGSGTLSLGAMTSLNSGTTVIQNVNQTATAFITGLTGNGAYTLNFTWLQSGGTTGALITKGDEGVVQLGYTGPNTAITADDYTAGALLPGRTQANDGHFALITATVVSVPEPSSLVLAVLGGLSLAFAGRRRL